MKRYPTDVHSLTPRRFEELVAELLKGLGWNVQLTNATRDGGIDILAAMSTYLGEFLTLVETKRYSPDRPVGVSLVRELYGTMMDFQVKKLRRLQRQVARRKKGSKCQRQAVEQLAKQQEHIANQRRDWWHKVTRQLVDSYGVIVLEDLNLNFMLQNGKLARSAHDVGLGMFRDLLDYKAMEAGVKVVTVNPAYTSQACSGCGCHVAKKLKVRVHACPDCGLILDRDVNAAVNILSAGTRPLGVTVAGCGERSPRSSLL